MQKFINNWSARLTQALSPSDTVIHIDIESANRLAVGFQQGDYYLLTLDNGVNIEVVKLISIKNIQLHVVRGQDETVPRAFTGTINIQSRITAETLEKALSTNDRILTIDGSILVSPHGDVLQQ